MFECIKHGSRSIKELGDKESKARGGARGARPYSLCLFVRFLHERELGYILHLSVKLCKGRDGPL